MPGCRWPHLHEQLAQLPAPVRRYLARALGEETRPILGLAMRQSGTLRTDPAKGRWMRFTASQQVAPQARRFQWDARIGLLPLIGLQIRDAYSDGVGSGTLRLCSLLPLASDRDTPELNAAALHRFLAEAPWYPTALLPASGVRWTAIDESRALATLEDAGSSVDLEFRFDPAGDVASIHSPGRWRRVRGSYQQCPWEGHFSDYRSHQGLRVPYRAEVGWYTAGALGIVWRGKIDSLDYRFAGEHP